MKFRWLIFWCAIAPVEAHTILWDLDLKIETASEDWKDRLIGNTFRGGVEVDPSQIKGIGLEYLGFDEVNPAFSFSLRFDGVDYTAFDDPAVGLPRLSLFDGELLGIDYAVYLTNPPYAEGSYFQLHPDGLVTYSTSGIGEYEGSYRLSPASIPEVSSSAYLAIFLILAVTHRRRR